MAMFVLQVSRSTKANIKLFIAKSGSSSLDDFAKSSPAPETLDKYTKGGEPHYQKTLKTAISKGREDGIIAVDQLTPPFENPWKSMDMGRGTMTGSITPWAQGPANSGALKRNATPFPLL